MPETVIGIVASIASLVLRLFGRGRKCAILTAVLSLVASVAFLIAVIRKKNDDVLETAD